jgi:GNAT superfamily N-acetyltransferase
VDPQDLAFRAATIRDAPRIAALVIEGFATYRPFAPPGWSAPTVEDEQPAVEAVLAGSSVWCHVAEDGEQLAGHCGWHAASEGRRPIDAPGLVHFWQLFVRRPWWGSGLAVMLHDAGVKTCAEQGYTTMRLLTPADHGRGRRFYEREGWTLSAEPSEDTLFGMQLVEYRREL